MKIEIQDVWFSKYQCDKNPDTLYVFGDNLIAEGCGGQATIRYCENSIGIPTKKLPKMTNDSFFNDRDEDDLFGLYDAMNELIALRDSKKYKTIVFPRDGLGTGLAEMPTRAPRVFSVLCKILRKEFNLELTEKGFV